MLAPRGDQEMVSIQGRAACGLSEDDASAMPLNVSPRQPISSSSGRSSAATAAAAGQHPSERVRDGASAVQAHAGRQACMHAHERTSMHGFEMHRGRAQRFLVSRKL
eukprot:365139-Chlamydomonas_euryale.AAC.26